MKINERRDNLNFNSPIFLFAFLPVFLVAYWFAPVKYRNYLTFAGSIVYYVFGEEASVWVLGAILATGYLGGILLEGKNGFSSRIRKLALCISVILVGGTLLVGKAIDHVSPGVSFVVFQVIAYLVDVYRIEIHCENSVVDYGTYICMFPKLLMGPLVEYKTIKSELKNPVITREAMEHGAKLFVSGLVCKVLMADRLNMLWNQVLMTGYENITTPLAWICAIAYSLKLYFDFYGYSLMAIGLGNMLGFRLPDNFRTPYMAGSVSEFYRRWHITLGNWFKKYVYIPLGGSRHGLFLTLGNLWIVWLLTGFWHGSNLNFMLWAIFLWCFISLEKCIQRVFWNTSSRENKETQKPGGKIIIQRLIMGARHLYLWTVIPVSWMFFAITDLEQLKLFLGRMFGLIPTVCARADDAQSVLASFGILLGACLVAVTSLPAKIFHRFEHRKWFVLCLAAAFWLCVHSMIVSGSNPFMYHCF